MMPLALWVALFYAAHSLLASPPVKRSGERILQGARPYRLFYSLFALALLLPIAWSYHLAGSGACLERAVIIGWGGVLLMVSGALVSTVAVLRLDGAGFLGLLEERDLGLVRSGLHGRVRHPIYSGILLLAAGWCLASPCVRTAVVVALTVLYLPVGIALEERKLIDRFGEAYRAYRREVPALFPRLH